MTIFCWFGLVWFRVVCFVGLCVCELACLFLCLLVCLLDYRPLFDESCDWPFFLPTRLASQT